ncbi:uncharacterized protein BX663DRAFT_501960 [Cokeromyces recurvatus]|uniref:uncharacterized protein n=1 Tax=Cokeromyces recurvatus TaxID=90255 RepID=UPI00221EB14E|nr:uncharacterized protein BX663DRAFT_501960 [Cokeromyces recurvatus]KAI7905172.1 hypothetical protein BX663DRAFT_501960 [Cokeromyces recurvatus]
MCYRGSIDKEKRKLVMSFFSKINFDLKMKLWLIYGLDYSYLLFSDAIHDILFLYKSEQFTVYTIKMRRHFFLCYCYKKDDYSYS